MKLQTLLGLAFVLAGVIFAVVQLNQPSEIKTPELAGLEFEVPPEYTRFDLGESDYAAVAQKLLVALESQALVAAVFEHQGDQINMLVDSTTDVLEEHIAGKSGILRKVVWQGSVRERLDWAAEHGNLKAPGMPKQEARNTYH